MPDTVLNIQIHLPLRLVDHMMTRSFVEKTLVMVMHGAWLESKDNFGDIRGFLTPALSPQNDHCSEAMIACLRWRAEHT